MVFKRENAVTEMVIIYLKKKNKCEGNTNVLSTSGLSFCTKYVFCGSECGG